MGADGRGIQEIDENTRKQLQNLGRHEMIQKLLKDIAIDLRVCELEGWDSLEYAKILKKEIDNIYCRMKGDGNVFV